MEKHHRQLTLLVNAPLWSRPTNEEIPRTALKKLLFSGLFDRGKADIIRMMAPDIIPALPMPVTAHLMMTTSKLGVASRRPGSICRKQRPLWP